MKRKLRVRTSEYRKKSATSDDSCCQLQLAWAGAGQGGCLLVPRRVRRSAFFHVEISPKFLRVSKCNADKTSCLCGDDKRRIIMKGRKVLIWPALPCPCIFSALATAPPVSAGGRGTETFLLGSFESASWWDEGTIMHSLGPAQPGRSALLNAKCTAAGWRVEGWRGGG